jgi:plastocyanin
MKKLNEISLISCILTLLFIMNYYEHANALLKIPEAIPVNETKLIPAVTPGNETSVSSPDNSTSLEELVKAAKEKIAQAIPVNETKIVTKYPLNETSIFKLDEQNTNNSEIYNKKNDIINNDLLTYYNESFGLKIKYPDYWTISTNGTEMLKFTSPIGIGGLIINKINESNLDLFLSERVDSLKHSSNDVQIIDSKDVPLSIDNSIAKSLTYFVKNKFDSFRVAEIMVKENNSNIFQIIFISNSSWFDTISPVVNKMLESMTALSHENKNESVNNDKDNSSSNTSSPITLSILPGASTQGNPSYSPATLTVKKGEIITIKNDDSAPNTVTSGISPDDPQNAKSFDTGTITPGNSAKIDTSALDPGNYPFHCTIHPYMKGTITIKG